MGASGPPPPPDTSKYSNAAMGISTMLKGWGEDIYQSGVAEWDQIRQWGQGFMSQVMPEMDNMFGWARTARDRYEQLTMPQIESLFQEADQYASKEQEAADRAKAAQDVGNAIEAQRAAHERRLREGGVDISELAGASLDKQGGIQQGAAQALAANQAGERTKQVGRDLRAQAIGVGQGFAGQYTGGVMQGMGLGSGGLNAYTNTASLGMGLRGQALPFMQGAYQGTDLAAGIVDTSYGRTLQATELSNAAQAQNFSQAMAVGQSMGSMIPGVQDGGPVLAPGGPTDDAGAIAISDGEYVIPADVVKKLGTNHFDKLIEKETGRPPPDMKQAVPLAQQGEPIAQPGMPVPAPNAGILT